MLFFLRSPVVRSFGALRRHTPLMPFLQILRSCIVFLVLMLLGACSRDVLTVQMGGVALNVTSSASSAAIDTWRVTIDGPGGERTRTGSPGGSIQFGDLQPGRYSVLLEGLEGTDVASRGQTTVQVRAGATEPATISPAPVLPTLIVSASDAAASELGPDSGTVTIRREGGSASAALVINLTVSGNAAAETDYRALPATITMAAGQRTAAISVVPVADAVQEPAEIVIVGVTPGTGYVLGVSASASVTIADAPIVTVTALDSTASEVGLNTGTFRISRTGAPIVALAVAVAMRGTASDSTDYQRITTPQTIPAGADFVDVVLTPIADAILEPAETAELTALAGSGYVVGTPASATVTIADAPPPVIALTPTSRTFTAVQGGANPPSQAVAISNGGGGTLTGLNVGTIEYVSGAPGWLGATLSTTAAPATLTLQPTLGTLPAGTYTANVSIVAVGANNSPQTVTVTLAVAAGAPIIALSRNSVVYDVYLGQAFVSREAVDILNGGTGNLTGLNIGPLNYNPSSFNDWLRVNLNASVAPARLFLDPPGSNFGGLPSGNYSVTVPIQASGVTNSPQSVTVAVFVSFSGTTISLGRQHSCALNPNAFDASSDAITNAFCWGDNTFSQLAGFTPLNCPSSGSPCALEPTGVSTTFGGIGRAIFDEITTGVWSNHTCARQRASSDTYCWGSNSSGEVGQPVLGNYPLGRVVPGVPAFAQLTVGGRHTCGRTVGGAVYCWGSNVEGQIGNGSAGGSVNPTQVSGFSFVEISAGTDHTCGRTAANTVYCWGNNASGEIGIGTAGLTPVTSPTLVQGFTFRSIRAGHNYTCGLTTSSLGFCWGDNTYGQLGIGSSGGNRSRPEAIVGGFSFDQIALGGFHACGRSGGGIRCWGANVYGQIGNGTTEAINNNVEIPTPVALPSGASFVDVSAGLNHTCGRSGNIVYCWGDNRLGQLGDRSTTGRPLPTRVP